MPSLVFRLLIRVLGRLSVISLTAGLLSLLGLSEGAVIVGFSFLGGLGVFEDEYLRWWASAGNGCGVPAAIGVWDNLERVEHDKHVHVFRRTNSVV